MGDFGGNRWRPYLDEEAQERRDKIKDYLEENFDGPSDFVKQALFDVDALSPEEKLEMIRQEKKEIKRKEEQLEQVIEDRERQQELRDKKELLRQKQEKLREEMDRDVLTREEAEEQVLDQLRDRGSFKDKSDEEIRETRGFQKKVEKLTSEVDMDELVEDVQRLQRKVEQLNDGKEDFFMNLEEVNAK